jgi:hypothetical protein
MARISRLRSFGRRRMKYGLGFFLYRFLCHCSADMHVEVLVLRS